jgi:hypothetical protein
VLFENGRRQRERLYKSLKLIVMKLIASKCNFLSQKCAKTHLRAFVASKNFPGALPPDPQHYRKGREGKGSEGKEKGRKERDGREGEGGQRRGKGGGGREGRGGKEGKAGKGRSQPPHQQILDPPLLVGIAIQLKRQHLSSFVSPPTGTCSNANTQCFFNLAMRSRNE